jgi:hypothetical protein
MSGSFIFGRFAGSLSPRDPTFRLCDVRIKFG